MREVDPVKFQKRLEQKLAAQAAVAAPPIPQPPPTKLWEEEVLLPDLGGPELTDADKQMDEFIDHIDIIDAYIRWCGKMTPVSGGKREGIMISCPKPEHADTHPSAWINLDKQTWHCGGCEEGGDIHDIAAYSFGYPVPGYKDGETFHKLREEMAESFGFHIKKVPGGKIIWTEEPQPTPPSLSVVRDEAIKPPPGKSEDDVDVDKNVSPMWAEDEGDDLVIYPTINWRNMIPEDTFLYEYMKACTNDDAPEEYHFWHGLVALGLVCARKVTLDDTQPVFGNLLVCLLGATGTGKSRSRRHLDTVLRNTAPFQANGVNTTGVDLIPLPSSGEYLVQRFTYEGKDPSSGKTSLGFQPVTGLVDFDEMSALLSRANRQGSTLKPTIMALADANHQVKIGGLQRGDFIAQEPFCSITASTQPKAIRALLSRNDTDRAF